MTAMTVFLLAPRAHATSRNSVFASPFSRLHITARRGELIGFEKVGEYEHGMVCRLWEAGADPLLTISKA
ncbi:MAG: hypothetical protein E5Y68_02165 [Mesorhizobium sp.]|nr:MAG: hypothetical protein E5Y68_02165 [Mesorhizobium sp.]